MKETEVDAYFFSKVYGYAEAAGLENVVHASVEGKPLEALNAGLTYLDNMEVPAENQVIAVSPTYLNLLRNSTELTKFMAQGDYDKNVSFKLTEYEGRKLVVVPPQRFQTEVVLHQNGYSFTNNSKPIDFMIMPKDAITHIVKYNKVKVLDGDMALAASNQDGFVVYARIYHDVFVTKNKRVAIYAHTGATTYTGVATGAAQINLTVKGGKVASLTMLPLEKFVFFGVSSNSVAVGTIVNRESVEFIKEGDAIENGKYVYAFDSNGRILAVKQYQAA